MKYEFTGEVKVEFGVTLKRIRCVTAFGAIAAGTVGGWIEKESNLTQFSGNAWVSGNALVYGDAQVYGDARVYGNAQVYGDARVSGDGDFYLAGPIGSRRSFLTVTADAKIGVRYTTGCFSNDLKTFKAAIKRDHGTTSLYAKQYAAAIAMAEICVKGIKKVKA